MSEPAIYPWDRQADETTEWHARFERFRLQGTTRSIEEAFRLTNEATPIAQRSTAKRPNPYWYAIASSQRWQERAEAWDDAERERTRKEGGKALDEARKRHLNYARTMQIKLGERLKTADIADLSFVETEKAMLRMLQLELECLTGSHTEVLQQELDSLQRRMKHYELRRQRPATSTPASAELTEAGHGPGEGI